MLIRIAAVVRQEARVRHKRRVFAMQALLGGRESMAGVWRRREAAERAAAQSAQKDNAVRVRPSTTATIKSEARGEKADDHAEDTGAQNEGESFDAVGDAVVVARAQALAHLHSLSSLPSATASTDTTEDEIMEALAQELGPKAQDDIEPKAQNDITAVTAGLGLLLLDPKCSRCGQTASFMRLIQENKSTFVCKVCNMRGQQLFRLYGQWPPREFEELPKDAQEALWQSGADAKKDCEELVCNTLSKHLVEREEKRSQVNTSRLGTGESWAMT